MSGSSTGATRRRRPRPDLPGSVFNRAFGLRQVPIHRPRWRRCSGTPGSPGWLVVGVDDPAFGRPRLEWPVGVHVGPSRRPRRAAEGAEPAIDGLAIRRVDPDDAIEAARWAELFIAGFEIDEPIAEARGAGSTRSSSDRAATSSSSARSTARDVAASALFNRRRVAWLGAGTVLPEARGRGIQRALIADRLRRGADAGSTRVMATAEIDTPSAANLERFGIGRIWTRGHLRVDPPGR